MASGPKYITWLNFHKTYIVPKNRGLHIIPGKPKITLFVDKKGKRIGLRIPIDKSIEIPPKLEKMMLIDFQQTKVKGKLQIHISTESQKLFREFFSVAINIADEIQKLKVNVLDAISNEFESLRLLMSTTKGMPDTMRTGLLGELLVLKQLIAVKGPQMVKSWLGPLSEPHDFRVGKNELEVKTTTKATRIHTINGLTQLVPSKGLKLYIISIQICPAGKSSGFSLYGIVEEIRKAISSDKDAADHFEMLLEKYMYQDNHKSNYKTKYRLRNSHALIPVNKHCPAITASKLKSCMGSHYVKVESIKYDINFEGLGNIRDESDLLKGLIK